MQDKNAARCALGEGAPVNIADLGGLTNLRSPEFDLAAAVCAVPRSGAPSAPSNICGTTMPCAGGFGRRKVEPDDITCAINHDNGHSVDARQPVGIF